MRVYTALSIVFCLISSLFIPTEALSSGFSFGKKAAKSAKVNINEKIWHFLRKIKATSEVAAKDAEADVEAAEADPKEAEAEADADAEADAAEAEEEEGAEGKDAKVDDGKAKEKCKMNGFSLYFLRKTTIFLVYFSINIKRWMENCIILFTPSIRYWSWYKNWKKWTNSWMKWSLTGIRKQVGSTRGAEMF